MKKIILLILLLANLNIAFASSLQSTNLFPLELNLDEIPPKEEETTPQQKDKGLSSGAITAITLGSIGGLGLGLLGTYLYKKAIVKNLAVGYACGLDSPILPLCLCKKSTNEILEKYPNNTLLQKALSQDEIRECPNSKYLLIPDSEILAKTFDTYIFEIPKNLTKLRITQAILPNENELNLNLFTNKTQTDKIKLNTLKKDFNNGIQIKQGQILNSNLGVLVIENNHSTNTQKYAVVIEFSNKL